MNNVIILELGNYIPVEFKPSFKKKSELLKSELIKILSGHVYCLRMWLVFKNLTSIVLFLPYSLFSSCL